MTALLLTAGDRGWAVPDGHFVVFDDGDALLVATIVLDDGGFGAARRGDVVVLRAPACAGDVLMSQPTSLGADAGRGGDALLLGLADVGARRPGPLFGRGGAVRLGVLGSLADVMVAVGLGGGDTEGSAPEGGSVQVRLAVAVDVAPTALTLGATAGACLDDEADDDEGTAIAVSTTLCFRSTPLLPPTAHPGAGCSLLSAIEFIIAGGGGRGDATVCSNSSNGDGGGGGS